MTASTKVNPCRSIYAPRVELMVHADRSRSAVALIRCSCIFGGVGLVLGLGMVVSGESAAALLIAPLGLAALGLIPGGVHATWWALRPGRVTYAVESDGDFVCLRGQRVVRRWPCAHIVKVALMDPMDWPGTLLSGWFGYMDVLPSAWITINTGDRWSPVNGTHGLPSILLWGEGRLTEAESELNAALARCRALGPRGAGLNGHDSP